jgi:hypothetical protein
MKMAVVCAVTLCVCYKLTDISEVLTASVIRALIASYHAVILFKSCGRDCKLEPTVRSSLSFLQIRGLSLSVYFKIVRVFTLQNANRGVDDMLQSGVGILENLRDQRMTLKGAHRRLYDIANTLGLSNTTMRLIERRAYQDKFILVFGMLFTLTVIGLIVVYCT